MIRSSVQPTRGGRIDNGLRLAAACGIVAPISFTTVVIVLGAIQPGYSHMSQAISELGGVGAPNATIQNINFVVTGLLMLPFAFGLDRGASGGKGSKVGPSLVAVNALAFIAAGFLQCDAGCQFVTPMGISHDLTGLAGFIAIGAAALILPRRLQTDARWQSYRSFSVVSGVGIIVFLAAFLSSGFFIPAYRGAFEILLVGTLLLWIEVMAIRLFQVSSLLHGLQGRALT